MKRGLSVTALLTAMVLAAMAPAFADEAIVATNSAWLKKDSTITGDVVVNDASVGPTLVAGVELQVDANTAITGSASVDSIGTESGASASGGFFCNDLDGVPCAPPLDLPVFDFLPQFETTTRTLEDDVSVGVGGMLSLDEDAYRDITVAKAGTLCFTGGLYDVRSITSGKDSRLLFTAPTVIRMDGKLFVGVNATLAPDAAGDCPETATAPSAAEVVLYVAGSNAGPFEVPAAAHFGGASGPNRGVVVANLYVPNGTTAFGRQTDLTGLALGRDVLLNRNSTVTEDSAFLFGNQPPFANPQDVATDEDNPTPIIITGSDPEGESLTFSITTPPTGGTLTTPVPIVPDPVGHCSISFNSCQVDGDCPMGETCILQQPAVTSATVVYTSGGPCPETDGVKICPEDSFLFAVTDPHGLSSVPAEVGINAPGDTNPPPDPLEDVVAHAGTVETLVDTAVTATLHGSAPCVGECDGTDDVELTFAIVSGTGPSSGTLGPLNQGSGVPQRTASVDYTPNMGFVGTDSFDFQVAGDTNGDMDTNDPGETSTATVTIEVDPPALPQDPVADPVVATTEMDTEIMIGLSGTPGDEGGAPLAIPFSSLAGPGSGSNGGLAGGGVAGGSRGAGTPITIGAGWTATTAVPPAFFWDGPPPVLIDNGPFTFTGEACVSVTDDFQKGDQFRLIDAGTDIGSTPLVVVDAGASEVGPDAAYADSTWSSGSFEVTGEGNHSIDIEVIPPNSFDTGRGYIRVDPLDSAFCSDTCGLTFTVEDPPSSGTVGIISQTSTTTAQILYTPNPGFVGIDSFVYGVTDCFGNLAIGPVDLTIIDVNACTNCYTLTVQLAGAGAGDVTSNPTGIACPSSSCSADFTQNSAVVLQARPVDEFVFSGWSGSAGCSGASPLLTLTLTSDKTCVATFSDGQ